jgi:YbbR domain-containing protein
MSDKSVKLRVSDLKKLMEWISTLEDKNYEVEITVSHSSGIGPSIEASVETVEGRGVWIDLSDYENW